jgi:hypothetical protein
MQTGTFQVGAVMLPYTSFQGYEDLSVQFMYILYLNILASSCCSSLLKIVIINDLGQMEEDLGEVRTSMGALLIGGLVSVL